MNDLLGHNISLMKHVPKVVRSARKKESAPHTKRRLA